MIVRMLRCDQCREMTALILRKYRGQRPPTQFDPIFFGFWWSIRPPRGEEEIADMHDVVVPQADLGERILQVENPPKPGDSSFRDSGRFVQLFAQHQRGIHAYICTLVPNRVDADDVMQETSLVLWRKWEEFDRDRDFIRWACGIAFNEVLKLRRRVATRRCYFNEELLQQLSVEAIEQSDALELRQAALTGCIKKLGQRDRELIDRRYRTKTTSRKVADELGRPASTVYKALARIRDALYDCVERTIAQQTHP